MTIQVNMKLAKIIADQFENAESIINFIATDQPELSQDKAIDQRDFFIALCRAWRDKENESTE